MESEYFGAENFVSFLVHREMLDLLVSHLQNHRPMFPKSELEKLLCLGDLLVQMFSVVQEKFLLPKENRKFDMQRPIALSKESEKD